MALTWYGQDHRIETPEASNQRLIGAKMAAYIPLSIVAVQVSTNVIFGQYIDGDFYPSHSLKTKNFKTWDAAKKAADTFNKKQK